VLKAVAGLLQVAVREMDFLARYGDGEFGLMLPATSMESATLAAERWRQAIASCTALESHEGPLRLTVSIGIAEIIEDDGPVSLARRAEAALRAAAAVGNCTFVHNGAEPEAVETVEFSSGMR
jgi:diguanylate cyclase (GGDEF)-like protein